MIFEQFYLQCLSHASYLVGDETTGRAVVVDPQRDVALYTRAADARGLTIERVIETHLHADFLSGHLELADHTGAVISYGAGTQVDYPIEPLEDGARLSLGDVTLEIVATPGHTPESISIIVFEHADDPVPYGVLTGDTLFIGDVGRPDLLTTAGSGLTADVLGRQLYHSLHDRLLTLPDPTRVFPAHGAGSACGKQLSTETSSTLGEQRRTNYALAPMSEEEFVAVVTEGQPVAPAYFSFDAARNREARPLLDEDDAPEAMDLDSVLAAQRDGAVLLDTREPAVFAVGHLRGAVNVGLHGRFAELAGDVLRPDEAVVLVGDPLDALEAKVRLARIGFDRVVGHLDADPLAVITAHAELTEPSSRLTTAALRARIDGPDETVLVDVRSPAEIEATGAIPGAVNVPLPRIVEAAATLDADRTTVVYCGSGYRSAVAASVLRSRGFSDVSDLLGGYEAWSAGRDPVAGGAVSTFRERKVPSRTVSDLDADTSSILLDVREPDEWEAGHAPDAWFWPLARLDQVRAELPLNTTIVCVCRSGGRSAKATELLRSWGLDAVNLEGGMKAWAAAGRPIERDDGSPGTVA